MGEHLTDEEKRLLHEASYHGSLKPTFTAVEHIVRMRLTRATADAEARLNAAYADGYEWALSHLDDEAVQNDIKRLTESPGGEVSSGKSSPTVAVEPATPRPPDPAPTTDADDRDERRDGAGGSEGPAPSPCKHGRRFCEDCHEGDFL